MYEAPDYMRRPAEEAVSTGARGPRQMSHETVMSKILGCGCIRSERAARGPLPKPKEELESLMQLEGSNPHFESPRANFPHMEPQRPGDGGCSRCFMLLVACGGMVVGAASIFLLLRVLAQQREANLLGGQAAGVPSVGGARQAPSGPGTQPTRLRITNGCGDEALWLAHMGSLDSEDHNHWQNAKIWPLESYDVPVPDTGMGTTRFWTKWRCVKDGNVCAVGDSGGPGQECNAEAGCGPPVDTKFESTFGGIGLPCNTSVREFGGCDFVDVSLKDGYTVPFELEIKGDCRSRFAKDTERIHQVVECDKLDVGECPTSEDLGAAGGAVDLRAINPAWGSAVGCMSPCSGLSFPSWQEGGVARTTRFEQASGTPATAPFCCPSSEACHDTPLSSTRYVQEVHRMCPGVNSYAYDRGMGVGTCPAGTKYEMIFYCPTHNAAPPQRL